MKQHQSKNTLAVLFVSMSVLVMTACDQTNNSAVQTPTSSLAPPVPEATPEAQVPTTWPYIRDTDPELSSNLIADNIYVVFDGSGSMEGSGCSNGLPKYVAAQNALKIFSKIVPEATNLGFLAFDIKGISERVALGINNRQQFNNQIMAISVTGGTPLHSAMKIAYEKLTNQAKKQLGYGRYQLVVVTDGQASKGENPNNLVDEITINSPVEVHTIGFCIDKNHSLNKPGVTVYKSAMDEKSLQQGLESTLAEAPKFSAEFK